MIAAFIGLIASVAPAVADAAAAATDGTTLTPLIAGLGSAILTAAGIGTATAVANRNTAPAGASTVSPQAATPIQATKVLYRGSLFVTEPTGEIIIDRPSPSSRAFLVDPDAFVSVGFVDSPAPPPCAPAFPDEVDWELRFNHVHDSHLDAATPAESVSLKVRWRASSARTIGWQVLVPMGA